MPSPSTTPNPSTITKLTDLSNQLDKLVHTDKPDKTKCDALLAQLKIGLIESRLLPPFPSSTDDATVKSASTLALHVYESATLYAVKQNDMQSFVRYVNMIKMFYYDYRALNIPSKHKSELIGLYLLYLLSDNKIEQFHTEVELLNRYMLNDSSQQSQTSNQYIQFSLLLEQYLMDGSYNKIINSKLPNSNYTLFYNNLIGTVQDKIADGAEQAYQQFPVKQLGKLLMVKDNSVLQTFIQQRGWTVKGDNVVFNADGTTETAAQNKYAIPAHETMKNTLIYAAELEKIV